MINIQNLSKQYGEKVLYNDVSMTLQPGKRYGLVGHNGAGKSVLLRIIAGEELADDGKAELSPSMTLGYLPQEAESQEDRSPLETVLAPFQHLLEADHAFAEVASHAESGSAEFDLALEKLNKLQEEMHTHDIYSIESRAKAFLGGLGVAEETWNSPIKELSGGYRMRVLLAQLLLLNPDFLLMDEPTNHLDMDSLIWLERFLQRFEGGMIIVSHDRDFLNRVITHTLEVAGQTISDYKGNLTSYFKWKAEFEMTEAKRVNNLNDKIEKTERFIERFKSKASKASQARSRMKYLDKLKDELPGSKMTHKTLEFALPPATPCGSVPIKLTKLSAGYEDKIVLDNVTLNVTRGDKIAIIGPNGAGKTTLLKTCAEQLEPFSGERMIGHNADIRFFSQHRLDELNPNQTLFDTVASSLGDTPRTKIQSLLGSFLFSGDEVDKTVGVLSGGEKSRLSLLQLLVNPGNTLLLDEPTNHLDIDSIDTVAAALEQYDGTILVVSHDEFFISRFATRIIEVRPGLVRDFPGSLKDYREYCEKGLLGLSVGDGDEVAEEESSAPTSKQERIAKRERRKKVERKIEKLERDIASFEEKIAKESDVLNSPEAAQNHELLIDTQKRIDELEADNMEVMELWESLSTELEELS
jgi:ATP-binding cassette subfamily F protein 3